MAEEQIVEHCAEIVAIGDYVVIPLVTGIVVVVLIVTLGAIFWRMLNP